MFEIIMAVALSVTMSNVTVTIDEGTMELNPSCAQVVADSGYTSFHDLSLYVFPSDAYVEACFGEPYVSEGN